MRAFRNIKAEMRENGVNLTSPDAPGAEEPARVTRGGGFGAYRDGPERHPHIDPWMEEAFDALTHASEDGGPFALVPCLMNGKPAAVIAAVQPRGRSLHVMPLFLACQPWMTFGGVAADDEEGEPE